MKLRREAPAIGLLCAAGLGLVAAAPAYGQEAAPPPDSAEVDPSAPLAPLPDLGVEWPELEPSESSDPPRAESEPEDTLPVLAVDEADRRYAVSLTGLDRIAEGPEIAEEFDEQSALAAADDEPANAAQIDRRSRGDAELLTELLRSRGYFDASVEPRIETGDPVIAILLEAEPGMQYRFDSVELPGLDAAGPEAAPLRDAFAVKAGDPVNAEEVIAGGIALQVALGERGFALASVGEQDIEIDHRTGRARLVLPVNPGPVARFGAVRVTGEGPFDAEHVAIIARWKPGEPFERSKVDDLRRALIATGLVSAADVSVVPAQGNVVDVAVRLGSAPLRTIAGELGYGTGEGIRAEASWQHRNFFPPEGALTFRAVAGTREQLIAAHVRRSNFRRRDQVLNLFASASNSDLQAYEAKTLLIGAGIERQSNIIWHKKWTWSVGADLLATDERGVFDNPLMKETRTFFIAAAPASLMYDGSNDLLDPTEGFRLGGRISPEFSVRGDGSGYVRAQLDGSLYQPVGERVVAAARVRLGSIFGAGISSIAPSRRFYSGGGGSVRGYGYQRIGPRDGDGDPIGGRGLAEFALEARIRLKAFDDSIGIVPFVDGGTLSTDSSPDFSDWRIGAGLGLRYYSRFGPIRIDVGTPLNPQSGDSRVAVTVSLGQAF